MLSQKEFKSKIEEANRAGKTIWVVDEDKSQRTRGPKLILKVHPGGEERAYWLIRYSLPGGRREIWPLKKNFKQMSLADARREFRRLVAKLEAGGSLKAQAEADERARRAEKKSKEQARAAENARQQYTLRSLLMIYVAHLENQGKARSAKDAASVFKNVTDEVLDSPASEVSARQVASDIRRVVESGKERLAGVLRSYLMAAFNLAVKSPYDPTAPSEMIHFGIESNPVNAIPAIPVKAGHRTLTERELKAYSAALGEGIVDQALRLALLSGGQRMAQLLRATRGDYDSETKSLRLFDGKGRRKQVREHIIPLGPLAAELTVGLVNRARMLGTELLFTSDGATRIHASNPGKRLGDIASQIGAEKFDLRDVRRTVETRLAALGINRDVRSQLLSHGLSGVQQVHYDRHTYFDEKRSALAAWEKWLDREAGIPDV